MSTTYLPAELKKGRDRWYILYSQTPPGATQRKRFRPTYDLNRIKNFAEREKLAARIVEQINEKLPKGFPYENEYSKQRSEMNILEVFLQLKKIQCAKDLKSRAAQVDLMSWDFKLFLEKMEWGDRRVGKFKKKHARGFLEYCLKEKGLGTSTYNDYLEWMQSIFGALQERSYLLKNTFAKLKRKKQSKNRYATNILEALAVAARIKCDTDRKRTVDMVESMCRIFTLFLKIKGWSDMQICRFGRVEAFAFLDYGTFERGIGPRTYNNYIERMRSLFNELKNREYIKENPFSGMKKKKENAKRRRAFNEQEQALVAAEIAQKSKWLMLGVVLQYHCFIRPIELRRLRFFMFDLDQSIIKLPGEITKNRDNSILTIPDVIISFLRKYEFDKFNQNWLIFGAEVKPHADKCCGHNTMNWQQGQIVTRLQKKGLITDTKGLTFYSWKDTDALALFKRNVNTLEIMRQVRHKDLTTTQRYCESLYIINEEIKALDNKLLPTLGEVLMD